MHHHHEHFWWRFFPKKELNQIYLSVAFKSFAISLVSLFVPIYLFKELNYSLAQTLFFFIYYSLAFGVSTPISAKFSARFGIKHSILVSVPLYLLFVLALYFLPIYRIPLFIPGCILGFSMSFYWIGLHSVFYKASDHKHRGAEVGKRTSISIFATMLGPLIGGVMIKYLGFQLVFLLASVLLFSSAFFLFLSKDKHIRYHFSLRKIFIRKHWENSVFFISRGSRVMVGGVIWPLFIFSILGDYFSLGIVGSVTAGVSAILIWVMGEYCDHASKRRIIRWTVGFESLSWFIRAAVTTVTGVFGATIFGSVVHGLIESPMGALEYNIIKGNMAYYFVSREVFINIGRILLIAVVLVSDSLMGGMIFNGVISFAALLL